MKALCLTPGSVGKSRQSLLPVESSDAETEATGLTHQKLSPSQAYDLVAVRLSLVGFGLRSRESISHSSQHCDEQRDELHSDLYSSLLETLRVQLVECVPNDITETLISRAIISAFNEFAAYGNRVNRRSLDASTREPTRQDRYQIEVDQIWRAREWVQRREHNKEDVRGEGVQAFLQELLDDIFLQIRREVFTSSDQVLRVVLSVVSVLGLKIDDSVYMPQDTIILQCLAQSTTREDLRQHLTGFGEVNAVAIANRNYGFAYCRFREEAAALEAVAARSANLSIIMLGECSSEGSASIPTEWSLKQDLVSPMALLAEGEVQNHMSPACVSKHITDAYWKHVTQNENPRQPAWDPL
jgi:RNA recognition motif. (a.k.a. RRM, RBD, or RNP domain)